LPVALGITLFGRLEVSLGDERIESDAFRKRAADLLKLLALSPKHVLHRDQLVEMMWPGKPPAAGANNLYRAVHDLRTVIGEERVTFGQQIVELHDAVVDVDVFEAETRSPDGERVARALDLYTDDLLPEDYDLELVTRKRELLRRTFVDASLRVAAARTLDDGRTLDILRRVAAIDPSSEETATRIGDRVRAFERPSSRIAPALAIPKTRYTKSGDVNIAYQIAGGNGPDLVFVMGWVSHVEYFWTHPRVADFFRRLAGFSRLILFDKRGTGLSDRVTTMPDLRQRMDDVRAVMVGAGSSEAFVMGVSEGGPMSALFAATFPERTKGLVIYGGYARRTWAPDYPWAAKPEARERFFRDIEQNWGGVVDLATIAPSEMNDPSFCDWWATYLRMSASPGAAVALAKMNTNIDIREELSAIRAPTLVLHRSGDRDMNIEEGRYLARHIPGARFVELPGIDHLPFAGDQEPVLREIEQFVRAVTGGESAVPRDA
jgi:pimeloyl-ACP methyl ester carboxylesterase/DNA-binding SARP family transcriptional activator